MKIQVDFGQVKGFDPVGKGRFKCRIDKVELRDSKSSDDQQLLWYFTITEGPEEARHIMQSTSFSTRALWKLQQTFRELGAAADALEELEVDDDSKELVYPDFSGYVVWVECDDPREWNKRKFDNITSIEVVSKPNATAKAKASALK